MDNSFEQWFADHRQKEKKFPSLQDAWDSALHKAIVTIEMMPNEELDDKTYDKINNNLESLKCKNPQ